MAGGLLAAHREYFFEIGGYGKNFEWKFRIYFYGFFFNLDDDMEVRFVCFNVVFCERIFFRTNIYMSVILRN